jgi:hypothetical protein
MARALALDDDGNLTALSGEQFDQLSDTEMTQGISLPGLLHAVYLSSSGTVDKATGLSTESPCIGFVSALLPAGKCLVRREGELTGFVGLTPGKIYYVDPSNPGGIVNPGPNTNGGKVLQEVGYALTAISLMIVIDMDYIVL